MDEFTESSIATLMGRQISIHRHDLFANEGRLSVLLALLGLLFYSVCNLYVVIDTTERGIDPLTEEDTWISFLFMLLWLLPFVRAALSAITRRHDRIILYEKGFTFHLRDSTGFCTWDEVEMVKHHAKAVRVMFGLRTHTRDTFKITSRGKPDVILDEEISEILALGRAIQDTVRHRLGESANGDIQAQGETAFGPLILSLDGIRFKQEMLPWSEIESVEVVRWPTKGLAFQSTIEIEDIVIRKVGTTEPWAMIPVSEIPNEFVLVDLAEHFLLSRARLAKGPLVVNVNE